MPYKSEKIKLSEKQDRRRKLTESQKNDIREMYSTGLWSLAALAKLYNVCKKSILLIVNAESKRKNDKYIKEHWKEFQLTKEEHREAIRKTRQYKQELFKKGQLKEVHNNVTQG